MVNSCLKNNSLISLECDFYNFLYSIEVMERYSYKKVFSRIALVSLNDSHANFLVQLKEKPETFSIKIVLLVTYSRLCQKHWEEYWQGRELTQEVCVCSKVRVHFLPCYQI